MSFCTINKTDKTEKVSDYMLEKYRKDKNLPKNRLWIKTKRVFFTFQWFKIFAKTWNESYKVVYCFSINPTHWVTKYINYIGTENLCEN